MKNRISLLICLILSVFILNKAPAQTIAEIDPTLETIVGWDYDLTDTNIEGFKIYRKVFVNNVVEWEVVGVFLITPTTTNLDLQFQIPKPAMGTYTVVAFIGGIESERSEELTLIERITTIPLAPTNLRVIQ